MKKKQNLSLEVLQFFVLPVLSLVSIFLKSGIKTQKGIQFSHLVLT